MRLIGMEIKPLCTQCLEPTNLDEVIYLGSDFIDLVERGLIWPSDKTLELIANVLDTDKEMLMQLRDEDTYFEKFSIYGYTVKELPKHIQNVGDILLMVEEDQLE